MPRKIYLIVDNIRSSHNAGALLRTAEGLGITEVILCGITPYPKIKSKDPRPPYLAEKITRRIAKTSLGAELTQPWYYNPNTLETLSSLKQKGVELLALEQTPKSIKLTDYMPRSDIGLVVGNEIDGVSAEVLALCDQVVEIPMSGSKESFNVSAAAAMALFYLTLML